MEISDELGYICRVVADSKVPTKLTNEGFASFASEVLRIPAESVLDSLKKAGIVSDTEPGIPFRPVGVFSFSPKPENAEKIISSMLHLIVKDKLTRNFLLLFIARYRFSVAVLEFLLENNSTIHRNASENCAYSIISSDLFLQAESVNSWAIQENNTLGLPDQVSLSRFLSMDWFLSIIKILRDENTGSFHGSIEAIIPSIDEDSIENLISSISTGILPALAVHNRFLYSDEQIRNAFIERMRRRNEAKKLRRFYHWLGIANDLSLGLEFLIGSIEFFPTSVFASANSLVGVYLFIAGSAQLVARSLIQIAMEVHLKYSRKRSSERVSKQAHAN